MRNWFLLLAILLALAGCKASDLGGDNSDSSSSDGGDSGSDGGDSGGDGGGDTTTPNGSPPTSYHTKLKGGYWHGTDYKNPVGNCNFSGCHGTDLPGDSARSCYTCHGQKWH